jgi:hypothetical protein
MREQDQAPIGQVADKAAEQVERFSGYLQQRDVSQIVGEVEDFARRRPAPVLGGAFVLGMIAARFLKSSPPGSGSGGYGTSTGDRGYYRYQDVPYRYEDVQGTPYVERGYAAGLTGAGYGASGADYGAGTSDFGTGTSDFGTPASAAGTFDTDLGTTETGLGETGGSYRASDDTEVGIRDGA